MCPFSAHGDDDGVFWIAFEDMLRYFDCIDVCKVRRGWSEVRVTGVLPPFSTKSHQSCTLLTVLEPTEVEFSLFQEGQRLVVRRGYMYIFLRKGTFAVIQKKTDEDVDFGKKIRSMNQAKIIGYLVQN